MPIYILFFLFNALAMCKLIGIIFSGIFSLFNAYAVSQFIIYFLLNALTMCKLYHIFPVSAYAMCQNYYIARVKYYPMINLKYYDFCSLKT